MASVVWEGAAQDVAQVVTLEFTGTWAADETASVTCNNKTITITGGSSLDTPEEYATAMQDALLLTDVADKVGDYTVNAGGREFGEFYDFIPTVDGAVLTLTSATPGVPFTVTSAETSSSGGITQTTVTSATGKNHFDNDDNWIGGSAPSEADTIVFDRGAVSVLYGLDNSTLDLSLFVSNAYTGDIGLPSTNTTTTNFPYPEYRQTKLDLHVTSTTGAQTHNIGDKHPTVAASGRRYLDFGTNSTSDVVVCNIYDSEIVAGEPSVQIAGGQSYKYFIYGGMVGIGLREEEDSAEILQLDVYATSNRTPVVWVGTQATFDSSPTVANNGGTLYIEPRNSSLVLDCVGGTTHYQNNQSGGSLGTVSLKEDAILYATDGTYTNVIVNNGCTFNATKSKALTVTNAIGYRGAVFDWRNGGVTWTNGIDLPDGGVEGVTLYHPPGQSVSFAAI